MKAEGARRGAVPQVSQLHLTGGLRATMQQEGWSLSPLLTEGGIGSLNPLPLSQLRVIVGRLGQRIIGGDSIVLPDDPLPARMWTPIGSSGAVLPAPLMWGSISGAAARAGDADFARLARHVGFSAQAAGIRLRDASDQYHAQLHQAIKDGTQVGNRYSNLQAFDLHLAFHSLASELSSARDYLATAFSGRLGLNKVDSLAKLSHMRGLQNRPDVTGHPVLSEMLRASDPDQPDNWLFQLGEYRNKFLHREPLIGSAEGARLQLGLQEADNVRVQVVQLMLAAGGDALSTFTDLYERLLLLLDSAARHAGHSSEPERVTIRS